MKEGSVKRANLIEIIKYGFGGGGSNFPFFLTMYYLSYFYTDIVGISAATVAGLMLVARLIDAFTDPLMGVILDRTKTKFGQFRPYLMFASPLLGISIVLLFASPNFSPTGKIIYAYVIYIFHSLASTATNIPMHAMVSALSDDPVQRSTLVTVKQGAAIVPQFIIGSVALPVIYAFGGGTTGWTIYGAIIAALTVISFWICASAGKRYDTEENVVLPPHNENSNPLKEMLSDMVLLFKNKPTLMLMIAMGTDLFANVVSQGMNMYYFKYVMNNEGLVSSVNSIVMISGIVALPVFPMLCKRFGKKNTFWVSSAISIIPNLLMIFIPNPAFAIVAVATGVCGFMGRITGTMAWAMLPDCVDYGEWKFGYRNAGLTTSTLTFMNKLAMAVGSAMALSVLDMAGFVANQAQTSTVLLTISLLRWGAPIFGFVATIIAMFFYELSEPRLAEIQEDLRVRHEKEGKQ